MIVFLIGVGKVSLRKPDPVFAVIVTLLSPAPKPTL